jgi:hypothetical protein
MKLKILSVLCAAFAFSGCVDIPDFSSTPAIWYNSISQETIEDEVSGVVTTTEVVTITIDFEDGDGDLGASSAQIQDDKFRAEYAKVPGWGIPANYELVTMIKQPNGTWKETIFPEDRNQMFPDLKPDGKRGPIKGKLDLKVPFPKGRTSVQRTVKYKVRIIDRAFHISNQTVATDEVVVPMLE